LKQNQEKFDSKQLRKQTRTLLRLCVISDWHRTAHGVSNQHCYIGYLKVTSTQIWYSKEKADDN